MKKLRNSAIALILFLSASNLVAQDVGSELKKLADANAKNYVAPLMAGWASGLNSGFYHSADLHDILGFDLQVKATFAGLTDDDKTYLFEMPSTITYNPGTGNRTLTAGVDYPAEVKTSTVVGGKTTTTVKSFQTTNTLNQEITLLTLPGGIDLPAAPLFPIPQVSIGLPFGFEVMGRFLPTTKLGDAGKVNFFGFGLRHDIDQYIPLLPLDIAVHFATQTFTYEDGSGEDLISASGTAFGVEVSKKLLILTVYGGFQLESSSWDIGPYNAVVETGPSTPPATFNVPKFTIEGKNKSRAHVGARLLLLFLNVHADYSFATTPVFALGVGISIR